MTEKEKPRLWREGTDVLLAPWDQGSPSEILTNGGGQVGMYVCVAAPSHLISQDPAQHTVIVQTERWGASDSQNICTLSPGP